MKLKIKPAAIIIVLLIFGVGVAAGIFWQNRNHNHKGIKVSGNIEGDDVRISFRVQGQILELFTDEGKVLKIGDPVANLNTDELTKIRDNAEAALKAAESQYELDKLGLRTCRKSFPGRSYLHAKKRCGQNAGR